MFTRGYGKQQRKNWACKPRTSSHVKRRFDRRPKGDQIYPPWDSLKEQWESSALKIGIMLWKIIALHGDLLVEAFAKFDLLVRFT